MTCCGSIFRDDTQIIYIRHAEVPGNDPKSPDYRYTGSRTDESLTEKGVEQAKACAVRIRYLCNQGWIGPIAAIYTSDAKRAMETGSVIAGALHRGIRPRLGLREIDWGEADGQLVAEMSKRHADDDEFVKAKVPDRKMLWDYLPVFKDAEKYNALLKRGRDELVALAKEHPGQTIIVVGHGRMCKTLIAAAAYKRNDSNIPYPENCGLAEFAVSPQGKFSFERVIQEKPRHQRIVSKL